MCFLIRRNFNFQIEPIVKVYNFHLLYTEFDLLADAGGYMGLFLGCSMYTFVEYFSSLANLTTEDKSKSSRENEDKEEGPRQAMVAA